jgi:hypothetical protein
MLERDYPTTPDSAVLPALVPPDQLTHQTVSLIRSSGTLALFVGVGRARFNGEQTDRLIAELQRLHPDGPR